MQRLAQSSDKRSAAGAAEAFGALRVAIVEDPAGAAAELRHAVTLDPTRERAWDLLTIVTADTGRYQEVASLCAERLRVRASARNYILLAKAYEHLNQLAKAEEQIQAALKLAPHDFTANVALAVLLIKRAEDPVLLRQAGERLLRDTSARNPTLTRGQLTEYETTVAIFLALRARRSWLANGSGTCLRKMPESCWRRRRWKRWTHPTERRHARARLKERQH